MTRKREDKEKRLERSAQRPQAENNNKRRIGAYYEDRAAEYIESLNWKILERNFRAKTGEIDIIAADGESIVFIEVKYRAGERFGTPFEAVDIRKQRKISRTALFYYSRCGYPQETSGRFDVIGIYADGRMEHIKNAFEFRR